MSPKGTIKASNKSNENCNFMHVINNYKSGYIKPGAPFSVDFVGFLFELLDNHTLIFGWALLVTRLKFCRVLGARPSRIFHHSVHL